MTSTAHQEAQKLYDENITTIHALRRAQAQLDAARREVYELRTLLVQMLNEAGKAPKCGK